MSLYYTEPFIVTPSSSQYDLKNVERYVKYQINMHMQGGKGKYFLNCCQLIFKFSELKVNESRLGGCDRLPFKN